MSIWTLWHADYGVEGLIKALAALVSVITAVALWPLIPRALAIPSPAQLQLANDALTVRIDERDAALAALRRETVERERAEAMLRQSQKMEAIGHLTGGIAHDFNNLLMVVNGNLERARRLMGDAPPEIYRAMSRATEGADRAAKLTQHLLAFARRAPLVAERHSLNATPASEWTSQPARRRLNPFSQPKRSEREPAWAWRGSMVSSPSQAARSKSTVRRARARQSALFCREPTHHEHDHHPLRRGRTDGARDHDDGA